VSHREIVERLLPEPIESFAEIRGGWTYDTYEVNGEWIFQFSRRPEHEETIRRQIALFPELAQEVSARIPEPEYVDVSVPVMGYRKIEGEPMAVGVQGFWPERLGRFLYDLHMVPPEIVGMRSTSPEAMRADLGRELDRLGEMVLPRLPDEERRSIREAIESFMEDDGNWRFGSCLVHGDLGPEHVLLTPEGDLAGVIDFEDVGVWDPVADFAWILHEMPEEGGRALAAYGGAPDERFRERARFAYALMPWHEVEYGVVSNQPAFIESGIEGVRARARFLTARSE
jgi:aminoglycoside phosphotransferase (APT) family kinase protein